jgi:hypothetical protein
VLSVQLSVLSFLVPKSTNTDALGELVQKCAVRSALLRSTRATALQQRWRAALLVQKYKYRPVPKSTNTDALGELAAARSSAAAAHSPSKASIFVLVQAQESRSAAPAHSLLLAQQL